MSQVQCQTCAKEFYIKPSHLKLGWGKYCSRKCRDISFKKGRYVTCETCNKEVWKMPKELLRSKSGKFFCNKSCQTIWRNIFFSGPNHPLWRGGEYIYRDKMLKSKNKQICKKCKIKDKRLLVVHHIDHNRKNQNLDNLVWLCRNCHFLVHNHEEKI